MLTAITGSNIHDVCLETRLLSFNQVKNSPFIRSSEFSWLKTIVVSRVFGDSWWSSLFSIDHLYRYHLKTRASTTATRESTLDHYFSPMHVNLKLMHRETVVGLMVDS